MPWWPGGWWPAGLVALVAWLLVVALVACWPGGLVAKCFVFGLGFGGLVAHCHQATKPPNHKQHIPINHVVFGGLGGLLAW